MWCVLFSLAKDDQIYSRIFPSFEMAEACVTYLNSIKNIMQDSIRIKEIKPHQARSHDLTTRNVFA